MCDDDDTIGCFDQNPDDRTTLFGGSVSSKHIQTTAARTVLSYLVTDYPVRQRFALALAARAPSLVGREARELGGWGSWDAAYSRGEFDVHDQCREASGASCSGAPNALDSTSCARFTGLDSTECGRLVDVINS